MRLMWMSLRKRDIFLLAAFLLLLSHFRLSAAAAVTFPSTSLTSSSFLNEELSPCNVAEPSNSLVLLESQFQPPRGNLTVVEKTEFQVNYTVWLSEDVQRHEWPQQNSSFYFLSTDPRVASMLTTSGEDWHPVVTFNTTQTCSNLPKPYQERRLVQVSGNFSMLSQRLGMGGAELHLNDSKKQLIFSYPVVVLRQKTVVQMVFLHILVTMVVLITLTMGAALDHVVIWNYCKRPVAPAIGLLSQYCVMPLAAVFLSKVLLPGDDLNGFGLLTIGCSPGGGASNMWTVLLNGDLNLSMTMTFLSSVAAFGMMPLLIFALGRLYITSSVTIPYLVIARDLLAIVLPVLVGMAIKWKRPNWAVFLCRATKPLSLIFLLFVFTFGTYANWYLFEEMGDKPLILLTGALLPWMGFSLGTLLAVITRQRLPQCVAIAVETGIQNSGIAIFLLLNSMPQPYGDIGATMPVVVSIFTPVPLALVLLVTKCYQRYQKRKHSQQCLQGNGQPDEERLSINT